jgi:predicted dehydrogenase
MSRDRTRRDFLKEGAAAATAAAMVPAFVHAGEPLDDDRPVPQAQPAATLGPDDPVRIGVIGTGGMGTGHVRSFMRMAANNEANVRIEALCDVCEPRLTRAREAVNETQGGEVALYADYKEVLARPDLHGVLIGTPEHSHAMIGEDAIKAGKDVYFEKPMTLTLKDALRLRKVAAQNPQVVCCVGTQYVMTPSYLAAQQLISEDAIGKPVWSQTSFCRNSKDGEWLYYGIDPEWDPDVNIDWKAWCEPQRRIPWNPEIYARWRRYRAWSTGIIGDLLVHHMTPLVRALNPGWPVRVVASGGHYVDKAMENHDQVNLQIEFEREHTMIVVGSTANELGLERIVHGHKGNLYVGGRDALIRPEQLWVDEVDEREIPAPEPTVINGREIRGEQNLLRLHWLDCIRSREAPISDIQLGTQIMVIVDLATRSLWEGGAFEFDLGRQKVRKL